MIKARIQDNWLFLCENRDDIQFGHDKVTCGVKCVHLTTGWKVQSAPKTIPRRNSLHHALARSSMMTSFCFFTVSSH